MSRLVILLEPGSRLQVPLSTEEWLLRKAGKKIVSMRCLVVWELMSEIHPRAMDARWGWVLTAYVLVVFCYHCPAVHLGVANPNILLIAHFCNERTIFHSSWNKKIVQLSCRTKCHFQRPLSSRFVSYRMCWHVSLLPFRSFLECLAGCEIDQRNRLRAEVFLRSW